MPNLVVMMRTVVPVKPSSTGKCIGAVGDGALDSTSDAFFGLTSAACGRPTSLENIPTDAAGRFKVGAVLIKCFFQVRVACPGGVVAISIMLVFMVVCSCSRGRMSIA
jgi:hypothetical protein